MNVILGKYNQLEVVKEVDFGIYLDGGDDGEILLPSRYVPEGCKLGDVLNVWESIGCVLIFIAIMLSQIPDKKKSKV